MNSLNVRSGQPGPALPGHHPGAMPLPMLTPVHAWRLLCRRTGGVISRTTFYRWLNSGKVGAIRMGVRFLIPLPMLEEAIRKCLDGERI